jgi:two-component system response regulator RegA
MTVPSPDLILLVDSCPSTERLAKELRNARGATVVTRNTLPTDSVRALPRRPSAVILAPGLEEAGPVVRQARELYGNVPILVIGWLSATSAFEVARAGADAYLVKPVGAQQILTCLDRPSLATPASDLKLPSLARAEWEYIHSVLALCQGNRSAAARQLRLHRSVLQRKLARIPPLD